MHQNQSLRNGKIQRLIINILSSLSYFRPDKFHVHTLYPGSILIFIKITGIKSAHLTQTDLIDHRVSSSKPHSYHQTIPFSLSAHQFKNDRPCSSF